MEMTSFGDDYKAFLKNLNFGRLRVALLSTKEVGKGTGLGMAITHKIIIENHRGKIDVKSHVGSGTEMIITLPLTQPKHPDRYML